MKYLITLVCIIFHFKVLASDPFTNEIGLIKEQPVVEIIQEEEVVVEENTEAATDVAELLEDETTSEEVIQVAEAVEEEVVEQQLFKWEDIKKFGPGFWLNCLSCMLQKNASFGYIMWIPI